MKLDELGIEEICARIINGRSMRQICRDVEIDFATLNRWLLTDPQRSARAQESRKIAAVVYEEMAFEGLLEASDPFELARAKEAAHHLRWRASKIAPAQYGDKLQHANAAGDGDQVVRQNVTINLRKPARDRAGD